MSGIETGIGLQIVEWFQSWGRPTLWYALYPFHYVGGQYGYLILLPIIYWAISKRHGRRLMVLALSTALANTFLKFAFARPRPFQVGAKTVVPITHEEGFGIPSGHTVFGTAIGGYVWYRAPHLWPRIAAVAFALLMGVSRIVHGVHFPQDVIAGWIVGVVVIVIFLVIDVSYSDRIASWTVGGKLAITAAIGIISFVLVLLVAKDYEGRTSILAIAGALVGILAGFAVEQRWVQFDSGGPYFQRALRVVVGLATTVGVFVGLDLLYDLLVGDAVAIGALIVYLLRYGLVSFWASAVAPALFRVTRLAGQE